MNQDPVSVTRSEKVQQSLYRIAEAALTEPGMSDLCRSIHRIIAELMPADNFFLTLWDEEKDEVSFPYFVDEQDEQYPTGKAEKGLTDLMLRTGEALLVTPPDFEELVRAGQAILVGTPAACWLGVPLKLKGKTIGGLVVQSYTDREAFGPAEKEILQFVSSQVALVVQRKQAEEALRASEEKYREVVNLLPLTIFETDQTGRFTFVNECALATFGYSRADFARGINAIETIAPEDRGRAGQRIGWILAGNRSEGSEYTMQRSDGSRFPGTIISAAIFSGGKPAGMRGTVIDVSRLRDTETALRESEASYRSFLQTFPGIAFCGAMDFRPIFFHGRVEEITGYKFQEMLDQEITWDKLIHPDDLPLIADTIRKIHDEPRFSVEREYRIIRKDGQHRWIHEFSGNVCDEQGRPCQVRGTLYDVTERKRAEQKLDQSERQFRSLIENASDVITVMDADSRIVYVSPSVERAQGFRPEELIGRSALDLIHPDDREHVRTAILLALSERPEGRKIECRFQHKDGGWRVMESVGHNLLGDPAVRGVVVNSRDITDAKQLEEELLRSRKLESLSLLAGGIAHDFNNILSGILGNISMAKLIGGNAGEVAELLTEAERACLRARDLTTQLRTFSRGGAPVKRTASVQELIRESMTFALRGARSKCEFQIPRDLWPIEVDEGQLSQVLHNLALNADQAMPDGGAIEVGAENVHLEEEAGSPRRQGKFIRIWVRDNGVGIPADHLRKVFDPYFSTKDKGRGLGLATSYSIVQKHDGFFKVASSPGSGTTFEVFLPASSRQLERKPPAAATLVRGKGCVLVMDDEEVVLRVITKMLKHFGFETVPAPAGAEALRLYGERLREGRRFDLVILDLTVPGGMGGKETIERLRELDPEVKAVVSSGYSDDPVLSDFARFGFQGVIAKPYRIEDLARLLEGLFPQPHP